MIEIMKKKIQENARDERKLDKGEISFAIFSKIPNFCSFQASGRSELQIREILNQTLFDWQVLPQNSRNRCGYIKEKANQADGPRCRSASALRGRRLSPWETLHHI